MPVAIGDSYASSDDLRRRQGIPDTNTYVETDLEDALVAASRQVDRYCGRTFGRDEVATERTFDLHPRGVDTDDFWTTDGLIISGTAWTADITTYLLEPANGVVDGVPGWPYCRLATGAAVHPIYWPAFWGVQSATVAVTAKWGWAEVPADVRSATLMLAAEELKLKDTPFGVAGFGDFAIRVRSNPKVAERLEPYRRNKLLVA